MAQRLCRVCNGWHDLDEPWPHNCRRERPQRSHLTAPMLIRDTTDPFQSMADGMFYDSKSAYRRSLVNGPEKYVELGNDAPTTTRDNAKPITKDEIGEAYKMVRDGYKPAPLEQGILPPDAA